MNIAFLVNVYWGYGCCSWTDRVCFSTSWSLSTRNGRDVILRGERSQGAAKGASWSFSNGHAYTPPFPMRPRGGLA